jgi:recombination protein RecA
MNTTEVFKDIVKENSALKSVRDQLNSDVKYIYPIGTPVIDIPFGGGIASGKVYEFFGWESAGKSTLSVECAKAFERFWKANGVKLKKKHVVLWIEAESALDKVRLKYMGCNPDEWMILEADTIEKTEEILLKMLAKAEQNNIAIFIVWDTIAATPMQAEKDEGGGRMANRAACVRSMFRKVIPLLGQTDSTLVLVNQLNQSFDLHKADDTPIPAIKFYASVRTRVTKRGENRVVTASGDDITTGIISELRFDKNKLIQRGQKALVVIDNERGFNLLETSLNYLKKAKLANIKGAGWTELNIPERVYNPDNKDPIGMAQIKFQTLEKLQEIMAVKYPYAQTWIDYLIYLNYTVVSPLVKVKIINKVWEFEQYFFGEKRTQLSEEEKTVAAMLNKELQAEDDKLAEA